MNSSFLSLIEFILYYISISKSQVAIEGTLECGGEIAGFINKGEKKYYSVPLNSNYDSIGFDGCQSYFDLELYLYDSAKNEIAKCDDCQDVGSNRPNCNHYWATDLSVSNILAGNYIFVVSGYLYKDYGTYTIQLLCNGGSTENPTAHPTLPPTIIPTSTPTIIPTVNPTLSPTINPTKQPTRTPTLSPITSRPTPIPTEIPTTSNPTVIPTFSPTTSQPTPVPTEITSLPTSLPTRLPTQTPSTNNPTQQPAEHTELPEMEVTEQQIYDENQTQIPKTLHTETHIGGMNKVLIGLVFGGFFALCCCCIIFMHKCVKAQNKRKYTRKQTSIQIEPTDSIDSTEEIRMENRDKDTNEKQYVKVINIELPKQTSFELHLTNTNVATNVLMDDIITDIHKASVVEMSDARSDDEGYIHDEMANWTTPQ